jgi:hypothetical protein
MTRTGYIFWGKLGRVCTTRVFVPRAPHAPTRANRTAKSSPDLSLHAWIIMPAQAAGRDDPRRRAFDVGHFRHPAP